MSATKSESYAIFFIGIWCFFMVFCLWIFLQIVWPQWKDEKIENLLSSLSSREFEVVSKVRPAILDRNNQPLAIDLRSYALVADPLHIIENGSLDKVIQRIADHFPVNKSELLHELVSRNNHYYIVLKDIPAQRATKLIKEGFFSLKGQGLYLVPTSQRYYPLGEDAASLVGLVQEKQESLTGLIGLERKFAQSLEDFSGSLKIEYDAKGQFISFHGFDKQKNLLSYPNYKSSIDISLQQISFETIKREVLRREAVSGLVLFANAKTGEILVNTQFPSFTPNNRTNIEIQSLANTAFMKQFEPGSTIKTLIMAKALEQNLCRESIDIGIDASWSPENLGITIRDPHLQNRRLVSCEEIIALSSNIGIAKLASQFDQESMRQLFLRFGLGFRSEVAFPGEKSGIIHWGEEVSFVDSLISAFGYGVELTPIQLLSIYQTIANDGVRLPLHIRAQASIAGQEQLLDKEVALRLKDMLRGVVSHPNGTARYIQNSLYPTAGKTGTTQKLIDGQRSDESYQVLFAGFAPYDNPHIVGLVLVDEPQIGVISGGSIAAPVFQELSDRILSLLPRTKN